MISRVAIIALGVLVLVQAAVIAHQHRTMIIQEWVIHDFGINWKAEHAAFLACRSGHLKEFQAEKRKELMGK
jgi:hypothetical protein